MLRCVATVDEHELMGLEHRGNAGSTALDAGATAKRRRARVRTSVYFQSSSAVVGNPASRNCSSERVRSCRTHGTHAPGSTDSRSRNWVR